MPLWRAGPGAPAPGGSPSRICGTVDHMTDTPPPQAVDYSGLPLTEGDPVAFLTVDPVGLAHGRIRIVGPNDLCIDTGEHLVTFPAVQRGLRIALPSPLGGTAKPRPIPDGAQQYPQVALQPAQDGV